MQKDVQLTIYDSVFAKSDLTSISMECIFDQIQRGKINYEYISKARNISNKNNPEYSRLKEISQQIIWGFEKQTKLFTGYVYFDVDLKPEDSPEFTKKLLFDLPFVKAVWLSFGGTGIGGIIYCPYISSKEEYKLAYTSLCQAVKNQTGIILDSKCSNYNRFNTISYDTDILIRQFPTVFSDIISGSKKEKSLSYSKYNLDNSVQPIPELISNISKNFEKDFYLKSVLVDKVTKQPILFNSGIKYNSQLHEFATYVDSSIINKQPLKNKRSTLAYNSDGYSCIKIVLTESFYFPKGKRAKTLTAICMNLIISNFFSKLELNKNLIYNLLLVLNQRCILKPVPAGEQPVLMPLDDSEINKLSTFIYNKLVTNEYSIKLNSCKSIRTFDFVNVYLQDNPEYTGDKHPRSIILKQIRELKSISGIKDEKELVDYPKIIAELYESYPGRKAKEYIEILSKERNISESYSKKVFFTHNPKRLPFE